MKKKGALITLLLVCLLVSMPAVAESFGMSNEAALGFTYAETKIAAKEEVTAFAPVLFVPAFISEILAAPAIPIPVVALLLILLMIMWPMPAALRQVVIKYKFGDYPAISGFV